MSVTIPRRSVFEAIAVRIQRDVLSARRGAGGFVSAAAAAQVSSSERATRVLLIGPARAAAGTDYFVIATLRTRARRESSMPMFHASRAPGGKRRFPETIPPRTTASRAPRGLVVPFGAARWVAERTHGVGSGRRPQGPSRS